MSDSAVTTVPVDAAFVTLPAGSPGALSIVQTQYLNATRQVIGLTTSGSVPGQNELRVDIFGISNENAGAETTLADRPLSDEQLMSDAEAALPGMTLHRNLTYVQNQYGPFGYALSRGGGGVPCLYGWQRITTSDLDVSLFNRRATIGIRLRICQPGASEANLVAVMMGLHVNASLSGGTWLKDPRPVSPDLGAPGAPIGPPLSAITAAPAAVASRPRPRPRPRPRSDEEPAQIQAPIPSVAPPPNTGVLVPPPSAPGNGSYGAPAAPAPMIPPPPQGAQP